MTHPAKTLSWRNRFVEYLEQSTPSGADCLPLDEQFEFADMTTETVLLWRVNQEEFTRVFSALMYGADLAYPACSIDTMSIFLRMVCENLDICDVIANCIENGAVVQDAIAQVIASNTDIQDAINAVVQTSAPSGQYPQVNQPLPASIMANNIIPAAALCTDENKYAMARAIVQQVDTLATDFLEIIEAITAKKEIAAEMIEGIPIFGGLASIVLDAASWIDDYVKTSYAAAYNSTTEVDYSCVIYCAYSGCELTWDAVIAAYETQASLTPPSSSSFIDFMTWMLTVIPSGDNLIVGAMHLFILNVLRYGSDWFGSGVWTSLEIAVEDAADEEITVPGSCACAPEYPDLVIGSTCVPDVNGTINSFTAPNTWRVTSTTSPGNGEWVLISDDLGRDIKIVAANKVGGATIGAHTTWNGACATTNGSGIPLNTPAKSILLATSLGQFWTYDLQIELA